MRYKQLSSHPAFSMRPELSFLRQRVVQVDAAVVGISRSRWVSVQPTVEPRDAEAQMRDKGFDVLPVVGDDGQCRAYFGTRVWGDYSSIEKRSVKHNDLIPFDTPLRDVIRGLANDRLPFFFLGHEGHIVGLISVANLNCRQAVLYVLGLMVELEVRLGQFVTKELGDDIDEQLVSACGEEKAETILAHIEADREKGFDAPLIEYIYFSDLVSVVSSAGLYRKLDYSKTQFGRRVGSLVDLRNRAAHPTRSLVNAEHGPDRLWRRVDRAEELLFALRHRTVG